MSRISLDEARELWLHADDEELKTRAQAARARYHEPDRATYMVMRIINYTNVCVAQCDYCAFYVLPNQEGGYVLSREDVFAKIDGLLEVGGDLVAFNGGFNPKLPLEYYCDLFAAVRERYGDRVEFYALTIAEFVYLADRAGLSHAEAAVRLRDAGVHWVTGGGSEILTEDFRKRHAKFKYTVREYFEAQRAIVESGMRTTATMVIGFDETLEERLEHLQRTRDFQDETGGLFSFLCWTYKPYGTAFGGREISPQEYWRHIALSRIFLDNVKHVRTSVLTQNEEAFRALDYGADDFDLPIEDEVTQKAGRDDRARPRGPARDPAPAGLPRRVPARRAARRGHRLGSRRMGFGDHAAWFAFTSDRFDHSSELPPEANAGNRFYGRDVASFVAEGLSKRGLDTSFLDEDWGWQAHAKRPDGSVLEISIYHNPDEDPAAEDDWALMVRALRTRRKLGISHLRETEVDADAVAALEDLFRETGIVLGRTAGR